MSIAERIIRRFAKSGAKPADFVVGGQDDPYLLRWHVIPRNRWLNVYLHLFMRSDDDRALHDHSYASVSWLLRGAYIEHLAGDQARVRTKGQVVFRPSGETPHRIELLHSKDGPRPCWTLFVTGPRYREWGFLCPAKGWVPWQQFTAAGKPGEIGRGCE